MKTLGWTLLLALLAVPVPVAVHAASYFGRLSLGSFVSNQTFTEEIDGTGQNDFATTSARLYFQVRDWGRERLSLSTDLRNKADLFGRLDPQALELATRNVFQVRQLRLFYQSEDGKTETTAGRFAVLEAGSQNLDGAMFSRSTRSGWGAGIFGGLDPRRPEAIDLRWDPEARAMGLWVRYMPVPSGLQLNSAWVQQQYSGTVTRRYWYVSGRTPAGPRHGLYGYAYLDFVPRTYVQNAFINADFNLGGRARLVNYFQAVDVIEYTRRRGVLERLDPSPYRELGSTLTSTSVGGPRWSLSLRHGVRQADERRMVEAVTGPSWARLWSDRTSGGLGMVLRRNFVSNDYLVRGDIGYFSKTWEFTLDLEGGFRREVNGVLYHPILAELSAARYFSRQLYATAAVQEARTERAQVLAVFLKAGYRFGSDDVAPLRDGAPPRGRL